MKTILASAHSYGGFRNLSSVKYIVIHYTAGKGDTAEAEGNYFKNVNTRAAGAHFFVGQDGTVVYSIDLKRIAWSVGGKKYQDCPQTGGGSYYGRVTNANSVSIELCDNLTKDPSEKQIKGTIEAINYIRKYCPYAITIVRHFDVTGKHCPARMMDSKRWKSFLSAISQSKIITTNKPFKVKVLADTLNVRSGASTAFSTNTIVFRGDVFTIVETKGQWGKLKSGAGWINCSEKYVKRV